MVSLELPETLILAGQMDKELRGRRVTSYQIQDYEKLQRLGFINKDVSAFKQIVNREVVEVLSRGNVIRVRLDDEANLVLALEYGGFALFYKSWKETPDKFHLMIAFVDGTVLSVRLTGMGVIQALKDGELGKSYVYARDFSDVPAPADEKEFTLARFSDALKEKSIMLKAAIVGKDAAVVGFGNSAFQDIAFRAKIHPKRKTSELSGDEVRALYDAIRALVKERLRLGGKEGFQDLYGKAGRYVPAMGPDVGKSCRVCGAMIQKVSVGGGQSCFCPKCQT